MNNKYINELWQALQNTSIVIGENRNIIGYEEGIEALLDQFSWHKNKRTLIFFVGNGGSSAIASHMTADFMKNGGMNTYSMYDNAVATCMGNDYGYEYIFSKPLEFLMKQDDLLVAISSSGSSKNIINAIEVAREKKAKVITLTGFRKDNKVSQMGDINVYVPSEKYGIVESIHNLVLQQVADCIMERDGASI